MSHVWDNFLEQLMKPAYILFVGFLSILSLLVCIGSGSSFLVMALMMIMPWALYGMCSGVIYFACYFALTIWYKMNK